MNPVHFVMTSQTAHSVHLRHLVVVLEVTQHEPATDDVAHPTKIHTAAEGPQLMVLARNLP